MKDQQAREDISNLAKRTFPTTLAYELHFKNDHERLDRLEIKCSSLDTMWDGIDARRKEIEELKEKLADQEQRTFRANQMVFEIEQRLKKIEARFVVRCTKCKQVIPEKEEGITTTQTVAG